VRTTRLIVEEGAVVEGKCEMGLLDKGRAKELGNGATDKGVVGSETSHSAKPAMHQHPAK
jgi:hypothetical protein